MFGSVVAVGATAARFAAVNAGPIGVAAGRFAAITLAAATAQGLLTGVAVRRRNIKAQQAQPTTVKRSTAAQSLRKARTEWKASTKAEKRAKVRVVIRKVGRAVRTAPRTVWRSLVRTFQWAQAVVVTTAFALTAMTLAATWLVLYALNAVVMYVVTATLGVTAAGLTYVFNRPFSTRDDAMDRANRAFLIYEPVYLGIRSLLHAAVLSPMRYAKNKWLAVPEATEAAVPGEVVTDEQLDANVNQAFVKTHLMPINTGELRRAPNTFGQQMFARFAEYPETYDEAYAKFVEALDSLVASNDITSRHRQQAKAGFTEARRRQHPQAS